MVWMNPSTGALAPSYGLEVGAGGGRGSRYHSRKIFENWDAKSCILVTTTLISGLPRTCISKQTTSMSRAKSVPKSPWLHPWLLEPKKTVKWTL